jgi:putative molybdopterin biosynthesis protein
VVSSFVKADGIIDVPQNVEGYEAGEKVTVRLTHSSEDIRRMLVISGSHDPLLDEVADIMRREYRAAWWRRRMWAVWVASWRSSEEKRIWGAFICWMKPVALQYPYVKKYFPGGGLCSWNVSGVCRG